MELNTSHLDLSGKNVVIVEDDVPSIKYYETLLKNSGAEIIILYIQLAVSLLRALAVQRRSASRGNDVVYAVGIRPLITMIMSAEHHIHTIPFK